MFEALIDDADVEAAAAAAATAAGSFFFNSTTRMMPLPSLHSKVSKRPWNSLMEVIGFKDGSFNGDAAEDGE